MWPRRSVNQIGANELGIWVPPAADGKKNPGSLVFFTILILSGFYIAARSIIPDSEIFENSTPAAGLTENARDTIASRQIAHTAVEKKELPDATDSTSRIRTSNQSRYWKSSVIADALLASTSGGEVDIEELGRKLDLSRSELFSLIEEILFRFDPFTAEGRAARLAILEQLFTEYSEELDMLSLAILQSGTNIDEIGILGLYLEGSQPGVYAEILRQLVDESLLDGSGIGMAHGEMFELAGLVGDESTVALLMKLPVHFNAYVSLALSGIDAGIGILEKDVRTLEQGLLTSQGQLALQLLAQEAYRQEDAAAILIDLARNGLLPPGEWGGIASLVAGMEFISLTRPANGVLESITIHRPGGDQVFYRLANQANNQSLEAIDQRLFLLDQLLQIVPGSMQQDFIAIAERLLNDRSNHPDFNFSS